MAAEVFFPADESKPLDLALLERGFTPEAALAIVENFCAVAHAPNTPQKTPGGFALLGFDRTLTDAMLARARAAAAAAR